MKNASDGAHLPPEREEDGQGAGERPDSHPDHDGIAWGVPALVPGELPACMPVHRAPPAGSALRGAWVSDWLQAVLVHWDGRRSSPCRMETLACVGCEGRHPRRVVCYGAALLRTTTVGLVELSQEATRSHLAWTRPGAGLRGRGFSLTRTTHSAYSRVIVEISAGVAKLPAGITLSPEPDLRAILRTLWGC